MIGISVKNHQLWWICDAVLSQPRRVIVLCFVVDWAFSTIPYNTTNLYCSESNIYLILSQQFCWFSVNLNVRLGDPNQIIIIYFHIPAGFQYQFVFFLQRALQKWTSMFRWIRVGLVGVGHLFFCSFVRSFVCVCVRLPPEDLHGGIWMTSSLTAWSAVCVCSLPENLHGGL